MDKWEELRDHFLKQSKELPEDDDFTLFALEVLDKMDELTLKYRQMGSKMSYKPNEYNENGK